MKTRKEGSKARLLGLSCMALVLTAFGVTGVRADAADAKKAPPNVTSVVNVNSHLRPVELIIILRCSSVLPKQNINELPPCTNSRKTSIAPNRDTTNHQYC